MATMKFEVSHSLSKDEAKQRVEQLLKYWSSKYGMKTTWSDAEAQVSGKVMGITLDARITITDKMVQGEGTDPGLLLRGKTKSYLQDKLSTVLDPKKNLDEVQRGLA
jgi:hypothetical protein